MSFRVKQDWYSFKISVEKESILNHFLRTHDFVLSSRNGGLPTYSRKIQWCRKVSDWVDSLRVLWAHMSFQIERVGHNGVSL